MKLPAGNSWSTYQERFMGRLKTRTLSMPEKSLLLVLALALAIHSVFLMQGRNIGNANEVRLAKLKADQELMAFQLDKR